MKHFISLRALAILLAIGWCGNLYSAKEVFDRTIDTLPVYIQDMSLHNNGMDFYWDFEDKFEPTKKMTRFYNIYVYGRKSSDGPIDFKGVSLQKTSSVEHDKNGKPVQRYFFVFPNYQSMGTSRLFETPGKNIIATGGKVRYFEDLSILYRMRDEYGYDDFIASIGLNYVEEGSNDTLSCYQEYNNGKAFKYNGKIYDRDSVNTGGIHNISYLRFSLPTVWEAKCAKPYQTYHYNDSITLISLIKHEGRCVAKKKFWECQSSDGDWIFMGDANASDTTQLRIPAFDTNLKIRLGVVEEGNDTSYSEMKPVKMEDVTVFNISGRDIKDIEYKGSSTGTVNPEVIYEDEKSYVKYDWKTHTLSLKNYRSSSTTITSFESLSIEVIDTCEISTIFARNEASVSSVLTIKGGGTLNVKMLNLQVGDKISLALDSVSLIARTATYKNATFHMCRLIEKSVNNIRVEKYPYVQAYVSSEKVYGEPWKNHTISEGIDNIDLFWKMPLYNADTITDARRDSIKISCKMVSPQDSMFCFIQQRRQLPGSGMTEWQEARKWTGSADGFAEDPTFTFLSPKANTVAYEYRFGICKWSQYKRSGDTFNAFDTIAYSEPIRLVMHYPILFEQTDDNEYYYAYNPKDSKNVDDSEWILADSTAPCYMVQGDTIVLRYESGNSGNCFKDFYRTDPHNYAGWSYAALGNVIQGQSMPFGIAPAFKDSVEVTFKDAEGENLTKVLVSCGQQVTVPAAPTIEGKTFAGWSLESGNAETIVDLTTIEISDDTTFYPIFSESTNIYDLNDDQDTAIRKVYDWENSQIYIVTPNGRKFNVMGVEVK